MKLESLFILWFSLKQIAAWMEVFGAEDQILKDDTTTVFQVYSTVQENASIHSNIEGGGGAGSFMLLVEGSNNKSCVSEFMGIMLN